MRIICTALLLCATLSIEAADMSDLPGLFEAQPPAHPELLVDAAGLAALRGLHLQDSPRGRLAQRVVVIAEGMAELPVPERIVEGRRLLNISRLTLKRVLAAALAFHCTGDARHVETARSTMLEVAGFSDWNPSHFLDVAEMTTALAIGYDWLHDQLSEEDRATIRSAIITHGLRPGMEGGWWVTATNNWNQVCHAGLTLGALAVREHEPELAAAIIGRALENLPKAMAVYDPDGAYPEGPGYWNYGTTYNVLLIAALESALGSDGGLLDQPGFIDTGRFRCHAQGPTGHVFNYSDGGVGDPNEIDEALFWFAGRTASPGLVGRQWGALDGYLAGEPKIDGRSDRFLPLAVLWSAGVEPGAAIDLPTAYHNRGINPIVIMRGDWNADTTWLGIKAGEPMENHGHMDVGSLVLEALGTRWIEDLGGERYYNLESTGVNIWDKKPGGERWTVLRHHNRSHSTLMVDGQGQVVDGVVEFARVQLEREERFAIMDLQPVYAGQLDAVQRGVRLQADGAVIVRDEFRASAGRQVRSGFPTRAEIQLPQPNLLRLRRGEHVAHLRIDAPAGASWVVSDLTPEREAESQNEGYALVACTVETDGSDQVLQVSFWPGEPGQSPSKALADW